MRYDPSSIPRCELKSVFHFFPSHEVLKITLKEALMERGGGKMSALSASGLLVRPRLLKRWMALNSGLIYTREANCVIHWIEIYLLDSMRSKYWFVFWGEGRNLKDATQAIQWIALSKSNNWGQMMTVPSYSTDMYKIRTL